MKHDNDNTKGKRFISICSGIEAASEAFKPLGWKAVAFSEIEPAPCSVLAHHYPDVPNHGDMTKFKEWPDYGKDGSEPIDLVCGGTPCQAFSVAGLREGLNDPRGNLSLTFLAIVDKYRPEWVLFENVPGILSSATHVSPDPRPPEIDLDGGDGPRDGEEVVVSDEYEADESHAFSCFLAGLSELGYGVAYRVIDAQYVRVDGFERAVPQRRRRVFVVGYLGDWRRAAAVLLEPESMSGNPAPSRKAGQGTAGVVGKGPEGGGGLGTDFELDGGLVADVAPTLNAAFGKKLGLENQHIDGGCGMFVAHTLKGEGFDASEDGTGRGTPIIPVEPFTLAIRGRGDTHNLEYRQDGTANAILTPNGGRAGIGVGAIAAPVYPIDMRQASRGEKMTNNRADGSSGGAPGTGIGDDGDPAPTVSTSHPPAVAHPIPFDTTQMTSAANRSSPKPGDPCHPLAAGAHPPAIASDWAVRRLTPVECARLQGFPDDYLSQVIHNGKPLADGPMYKGLGNSWPVNSVRWIGRRIQMVEEIATELDAANDNYPSTANPAALSRSHA